MYKSTVFNTFNRHVPIKKKCIRANVKLRFDIVTATSNVDNFGMYKSTIFNTFNRHLPIKKKYIRANAAVHVKRLMQHFMSKELYKTIMKRSRLKLTSHSALHYLWLIDLSKSSSELIQLVVSIFINCLN